MAGMVKKSFENCTDVRPFVDGKGEFRVIDLDGPSVGMATFEPGWRWSEHVKPIAGTSSCQTAHAGYVLSGHMTVRMDDGSEENFDPGDVMLVPPGHDAWIVGKQPCVILDWQGYVTYAKPQASTVTTKR